jgi:O-antigen ligase
MILPLAVHFALGARSRNERIARWALVVLVASSIPFSGSRAAFVGLVAGIVPLAVRWSGPVRIRAALAIAAGLGVVHLLVPGLLGTMRYLFLNADNDPSAEARTDDYPIVFGQIGERPWFGRGFGTYIPEVYRVLDNQLLGLVVSSGFLVTLAMIGLVGTALWCVHTTAASQVRAETRHLAASLEAAVIVGMFGSLLFDSLSFASFTGLMAFLLGCCGALWRVAKSDEVSDETDDPYVAVLRRPRTGPR